MSGGVKAAAPKVHTETWQVTPARIRRLRNANSHLIRCILQPSVKNPAGSLNNKCAGGKRPLTLKEQLIGNITG